tara:strand:- start:6046 stop:7521 length:1476 start_codon:yes stop_codon:yes gene_type:complete
MISFNDIPNNVRVPGSYVEMDNTNATNGLATEAHVMMLIGQTTSAGTEGNEEVISVFSADQAATFFGVGSQLHLMCKSVFTNQNTMQVQAIGLADDGGATPAQNTITLTGVPTAGGTLHLHIAGVYTSVGVLSTDTISTIATRIADEVTANTELPITASATLGVTTFVAKNGGTVGNDMPIILNWFGASSNHFTPDGLTVTIAQSVAGATDPDVGDAIAVFSDTIINHIVCPYSDNTSLTAIKDEMDRRWNPIIQLEGHAFTASKGTASALITIGGGHNNEHLTYWDSGQTNPTPSYVRLCALVGRAAPAIEIDPARPVQTLDIKGCIGDKKDTQRTYIEATALLNAGIATVKITRANEVLIERMITTYQTSQAGAPDISYLDANTVYTLTYLRQTLLNRIRIKFPRHKLANDGTRIPAGQAMVTPSVIAGEIIALAALWGELGLVEDLQVFAETLKVERNAMDPNRVDAVLPTNLVNQFRVFAASLKFIL